MVGRVPSRYADLQGNSDGYSFAKVSGGYSVAKVREGYSFAKLVMEE